MRNVYLVRHGKPAFPDGVHRCIGRTELPLDSEGVRQAKNLSVYMRNHPVTHIYCSPLERCVDTAKIISENKIPITVIDDFAELYMGEWENVPLKEIKKTLESEPEHGERRRDGLNRFKMAMNRVLKESRGDIVCVAHAGVNCCFLSDLLGTDLAASRALPQPYGGFSRIEVEGDGIKQVAELGRMPERAPDDAKCKELWKKYGTPEMVIRHSRAVAAKALDLAEKLNAAECPVDTELVYGSALMHDVARAEKNHAQKGAEWMLHEGYPEVAEIVFRHHDLKVSAEIKDEIRRHHPEVINFRYDITTKAAQLDEAEVVYLADKYVMGEQAVSLEERFEKSRRKCEASVDRREALAFHERRFMEAKMVEKRVWSRIEQGN